MNELLSKSEIEACFAKAEAVVANDHFVYKEGEHGPAYVNKDALYVHPLIVSSLCKQIALEVEDHNIDVVVGPAMGGVLLSQGVGYHLTRLKGKNTFCVFLDKDEKNPDAFVVKRGYGKFLMNGAKVLVVEDILNTGSSVRAVLGKLIGFNCEVVGIAALCNRGGVTSKDLGGVPLLTTLLDVTMAKFDPKSEEGCPLCHDGVPINTELGKGKKYLEDQGLL